MMTIVHNSDGTMSSIFTKSYSELIHMIGNGNHHYVIKGDGNKLHIWYIDYFFKNEVNLDVVRIKGLLNEREML